MNSYPSSAQRTRPSQKMGNPWRWPAFKIRWRSQWWRIACEDCLASVATRRAAIYYWPKIRARYPRKKLMLHGRHIFKRKRRSNRSGEARIAAKEGGVRIGRGNALRTVSIAKPGGAVGATRVIESTIMRPSVHEKRTVRVAPLHKNGSLRNLPINPFPRLPWNLLFMSGPQTWMDQRGLPGSTNTLFRQPWK